MKTIKTRADLAAAITRIGFAPSCIGLEKAILKILGTPLSTLLAELHDLTPAQWARVRRILDVIEGEGSASAEDIAACRAMARGEE